MSKKNNVYTLILKYCFAKKYKPSSEPSASHNLLADGGSMLMAADWVGW